MIKRGVYAAGLSVIGHDMSLDVDSTIDHAENIIKNGLHGVFFFGSTGQSQLISVNEKKDLISKIAHHKLRDQFYIGTGSNSLKENIDLIKYGIEYKFDTFLIMPPAYYKNNSDEGVYHFYKEIITKVPKCKIILYNFEKLSSFLFKPELVKKLASDFPKNIIGVKDSSYNLYENLKIPNFLIFPGSEAKLVKSLELGCAGCISAVTNVTHSIARKVFDDFEKKSPQSMNTKLISVREAFDKYHLIAALHLFMSCSDKKYKNLLPPLVSLSDPEEKELLTKLENLDFLPNKGMAA
tara:strand:- start:1391 stop:2275 length:885 start_codon:yes stop_codon:yes gene_type:complete